MVQLAQDYLHTHVGSSETLATHRKSAENCSNLVEYYFLNLAVIANPKHVTHA